MGRPIQGKWFGNPTSPGYQIVVNGIKWADGTTSTNGWIVSQTGSTAYMVTNGSTKTEICFLANANSTSGLLPSQCYILATPFGGSALPCFKIAQFRLSVYVTPNSATSDVVSYSWSDIPANAAGEADLIPTAGRTATGTVVISSARPIASVNVTAGGAGYTSVPAVTFTGGGTGATATAVLTNGVVSSVNVTAGGSGYTSGTLTIAAPPAAVTATGTATITTGAITAINITAGGHYYTVAPSVTISGDGTGASATAVISNGVVTGVTSLVGGSGYTTATVTFGAAPASVNATATGVLGGGAILGITITDAGDGYTHTPSVTISGNGTGATATATVASGSVSGTTITAAGSGYTTATVTFGSAP